MQFATESKLYFRAYDAAGDPTSTIDWSQSTVQISKDGGSFTACANTPVACSDGWYCLTLTASEMSCDAFVIRFVPYPTTCTIPPVTGEPQRVSGGGGGGATAQEVWEYSGRTLTASPTDISGLATASSISTLQTSVDAIPTTAAPTAASVASAVWGADSRTITGDVTVESAQAATFVTATGFATPSDVTTAKEAILTRGNSAWVTASGFATPSDVQLTTTTQTVNVTTQTVDLSSVLSALNALLGLAGNFTLSQDTLTAYNADGTTNAVYSLTRNNDGEITAIEPVTNDEQ